MDTMGTIGRQTEIILIARQSNQDMRGRHVYSVDRHRQREKNNISHHLYDPIRQVLPPYSYVRATSSILCTTIIISDHTSNCCLLACRQVLPRTPEVNVVLLLLLPLCGACACLLFGCVWSVPRVSRRWHHRRRRRRSCRDTG